MNARVLAPNSVAVNLRPKWKPRVNPDQMPRTGKTQDGELKSGFTTPDLLWQRTPDGVNDAGVPTNSYESNETKEKAIPHSVAFG